jgi:VanZ family protein
MPSPPETGIEGGDKLGHLLAYGGLMLWFCFLYRSVPARVSYAFGFAAMGVALEFAQGALGYRLHDTADMAANALGVLLGWAIAAAAPTILRR